MLVLGANAADVASSRYYVGELLLSLKVIYASLFQQSRHLYTVILIRGVCLYIAHRTGYQMIFFCIY